MAEGHRYVARRDVTVNVKDADDASKTSDKNPRHDSQHSVTLEPGDSLPESEVADLVVQAVAEGKLAGVLDKVTESGAAKFLEESQGGEDGYSPFTMRQKGLSES